MRILGKVVKSLEEEHTYIGYCDNCRTFLYAKHSELKKNKPLGVECNCNLCDSRVEFHHEEGSNGEYLFNMFKKARDNGILEHSNEL